MKNGTILLGAIFFVFVLLGNATAIPCGFGNCKFDSCGDTKWGCGNNNFDDFQSKIPSKFTDHKFPSRFPSKFPSKFPKKFPRHFPKPCKPCNCSNDDYPTPDYPVDEPGTPENPDGPTDEVPDQDTTVIVNPHKGNTYSVGGDGQLIELRNNPDADNPTYAELVEFIKDDDTDRNRYTNRYVCSDFAEDVHNNAEAAGIKAAWVTIKFNRGYGHACNAFYTTDEGLVYIDCTGVENPGESCDRVLTVVEEGKKLSVESLYPPYTNWYGMDNIVTEVTVYW